MITIISRKRHKNLQLMRIFKIDEDNAENNIQFEEKYGEYKNIFGKISAYEYICQDYQLYSLLKSNDKNKIKSFILNKIQTIQNDANNLNISLNLYDYLNKEQINEIINIIIDSPETINILDYLYQSCFKHDNKSIVKKKRIG